MLRRCALRAESGLDEGLSKLVGLSFLDISENALTSIPNCVYRLRQLETLLVQKNDLRVREKLVVSFNLFVFSFFRIAAVKRWFHSK